MRPYRIGLIAVHSTVDYPHSLRVGVQNTVEMAGHTLVPIAELIPYHHYENVEPNLRVATEIVRRLDLDCVIFPVGCMTAYLRSSNPAIAMELALSMNPAKTLIVERQIDGYRCVNKDNVPGMHECMRHLIEERGFTRIGFVSGPETSQGARERESVYFEEMRSHGLEVRPSFFARGNFAGTCPEAIEQMLDDNPDLEAIACACDLIAYTAYEVVRRRGLTVGEDIAITGFDDNERSVHMDPPLSTVHITSYDLGCLAAREALRMCAGEPQVEYMLNSTFVARSSCGEGERNGVEYYKRLLRQGSQVMDLIADQVVEASTTMITPRNKEDFRRAVCDLLDKAQVAYARHLAHPDEEVPLASSQDLVTLFDRPYRDSVSIDGFHNVAVKLLEALLEESAQEDSGWVVEQISELHLHIARMLNNSAEMRAFSMYEREWDSFHMVDATLREEQDPVAAYKPVLQQFSRLGVREADIFLLPDPVEFTGAHSVALSDQLLPFGRVSGDDVEVTVGAEPIAFQSLLESVLPRYREGAICTVSGIMAGNELIGIVAVDAGELGLNGQLMAFLNLGFALKHLQMIENANEMNRLLNKNNLLLQQQSQHDDMTALLNRRGFINRFDHVLRTQMGDTAAVMYMDLDGLKGINDTFGHDEGDDAIQATAQILGSCIPADGLLCRLGGDEFVACVFVEDEAVVDSLAQAIQEAMAAYNHTSQKPYELSISVGWAFFAIDESSAARRMELLAQADERLYEMKRRRKARRV